MDRRSWLWKKKSSDKTVTATETNTVPLASSGDIKAEQEDTPSVKYVQIPVESYEHLTELEDEVKNLNEKVSDLNAKLSAAQAEIVTKDNLVKQHAKVAEEAVSGWEKAEAEALALKQQLETVTLLKLTSEDRASHLDGALKECMKQVRNVKEESEQKLHDIVLAKTRQWEKAKAELEAKILDSEQELRRSSAEIAALSRTLQERSNLLVKISDEKAQADAEIEVMKSDIESCEREISSLKYELHVISKELEIRNEEKNMSVRSAEVANKQHLEDIKKITKLEAECQRLRGLVRKKLPGPAALAQMKIEVENLGREYGETRLRRSPAKSSSPHHVSPSDFALENMQHCRKENEFLTTRLLTMEEEMKMLKEALSKRNSELQASRNMCAKTTNKLRSMEAHVIVMNQQKSTTMSVTEIPVEIESKPPSLTSMSEDGIDDEGSCSESWASALISELSQFKKEKNLDKTSKADNSKQLELMDDFLEMERLACESTAANGSIAISNGRADKVKTKSDHAQKDVVDGEHQNAEHQNNLSSDADLSHHESTEVNSTLSELRSKINYLFDSQSHNADMEKLLEDIRFIVQDAHNDAGEAPSVQASCMQKECNEGTGNVEENETISKDEADVMVQDMKDAIYLIHEFILSIAKQTSTIQGRPDDNSGLTKKIEELSAIVNKVQCNEQSDHDFLLALSNIFSEKGFLNYIMPSDKCNEAEIHSSDCIDKVTLLENRAAPHEHAKSEFSESCMPDSSASDPEIEAPVNLSCELKVASQACSMEEYEQLKLQKQDVELDLVRCKEMLDKTNHQLAEMEQHLSELKSKLAASEKSNSLAETQLKCMVESYKSLESQKQEVETELSSLQQKMELLEAELDEERNSHQEDLAKYRELQDEMERNSKCSIPPEADVDIKAQQEKEIAEAAEKLAACQETIFLLGKQLNSLRPSAELNGPSNNRHQTSDGTLEDDPSASSYTNGQGMLSPQHLEQPEAENVVASTPPHRTEGDTSNISPSDTDPGQVPKSPLSSKNHKHRSRSTSTSFSSPSPTPEKHGRGFSRFFSKGKSEH